MEKFPLNPSPMFADRGTDVVDAMHYATQLAEGSSDAVAVYTAVNVLMNTVINWVNAQPDQFAAAQLEAGRITTGVSEWLEKNAETVIARVLSDSTVVESQVRDWLNNSAEDVIEHWLEYDADLPSQIETAIENADLSDQIEATIQDMDLVVRVR